VCGNQILQSFKGCTDPFNYIPPDTTGAVGINHVMSVSNDQFRIHNKATGNTISSVTPAGFWSGLAPLQSIGDPKMYYDPYGRRFISCDLEYTFDANGNATVSNLLIAVSKTSNPTQGWWQW